MKRKRDSRRLPEKLERWYAYLLWAGGIAGLIYWVAWKVWAWVGW